jgi:chromosome segregation ATPase
MSTQPAQDPVVDQQQQHVPGSSTTAHIQQPSESVGSIAADRVEKKKKTTRGGGGGSQKTDRALTTALKKMEKKVESMEKKLDKMHAQNTKLKEENKLLRASNSRILRIPKPATT